MREKKKINEAFQIFVQLPPDKSSKFADEVTSKISRRRLVDLNVTDTK